MKRRILRLWVFFMLALLLVAADRLHPGDLLPDLTGQTLSGQPITLSSATRSAHVVVFSFTHASAGDSRLWIDHVTQDAQDARTEVFQVIELESAPRLVRGMASAGIRSATPR